MVIGFVIEDCRNWREKIVRIGQVVLMGILSICIALPCGVANAADPDSTVVGATKIDQILARENTGREFQQAGLINDRDFLRRVTVDLVGRIPTAGEIRQFEAWPAAERRARVVDKLLEDERFPERWTVFFGDMLRLRSNAEGGSALTAYVYKAIKEGMPYDELSRRLIAANGKAGATPEVGFILGDNADPMALAGVTSQVFLGIRVACAECHDHPFDVWTREQFYGLAAYFGKTRRVESELLNTVYTTETTQSTVLWPPADEAGEEPRAAMTPAFPFDMIPPNETPEFIARLEQHRAEIAAANRPGGPTVDDLILGADEKVQAATSGNLPDFFDVAGEARTEGKKLDIKGDLYRASELRIKLAELITSPRNEWFARSFVNRVWKELIGRGIVEPVDDFTAENLPSHPEMLDHMSREFVAGGYDLKQLLRMICSTQIYQRNRLYDVDEATLNDAEAAFASAPMRRMIAEVLYDSIVQAGHLEDFKWPEGSNLKMVRTLQRIAIPRDDAGTVASISDTAAEQKPMMMKQQVAMVGGGYDLERAIEVDFEKVLMKAQDAPTVDRMQVMSKEEVEAMQMMEENGQNNNNGPRMRYVERYVDVEVDDNPRFASAMRMAAPAAPSHFLRIFGQPARQDLGDHREEEASMRQALMMLNGSLTHEASRVGDLEPICAYLVGSKANLDEAIGMAYREILTRNPNPEELDEAKQIVEAASSWREGMADLRWVLFNCHEFRFMP